ncbi:hypothetical protein DVA67_030845 [Solirubrobacter sp. CPCC 204708]|uniref:Uncharacterized protein n=1 Tax=Solirubrobacter deserti TaxID=2282478 RepID=A0ABT4RLL6_9ACTN|nr:hypothetical protein [Solirubrobacter deserti]MBE2320401.1 hypothetical protein [Solirubrobacter deserti]MDA0139404.1 hypothetical protein [Solirubrobacter deserti]
MLTLRMRRVTTEDPLDGIEELLAELGDAYRPLLRDTLRFQADGLGIDAEQIQSTARTDQYGEETEFGEVLAVPEGVVAVQIKAEARRYLPAVRTGRSGRARSRELSLFGIGQPSVVERLAEVAAAFEQRFSLELEPFAYESDRFTALKEEGMTPPDAPSDREKAGAQVLADPVVRRAAVSVASSGGLLVGDLPKQLPQEDRHRAADVQETLESEGLVDVELVVICKRTSAQVARVPSRDALEQAASAGLRCACGKALLDERVEEALSLAALGRQLLDGSWWLSVLLMEELRALGVSYESMLIEAKDGGDEMDCFADISGELTLFELKDKEFSLGNAYSFGAKIGIYRPEHAVIVTTSHVGGDAREHFKRSLTADTYDEFGRARGVRRMRYVEGVQDLASALEELADEIYGTDAQTILRRLLPMASVDAGTVISAIRSRSKDDEKTIEEPAPTDG